MSRCFPFPPPGYAGKSNEALIFSIKLQSENEKATSDRGVEKVMSSDKKKDKSSDKKKDKSSDKKDRKKEKKDKKREKEKLRSAPDGKKQMCVDKLYKSEKPLSESKGKQSLLQHSSELLERSIVTEEHGRPVESQIASCSSDSTSNSTKRKRHSSPANTIQSSGGNVFRIRLSSSQKGDETSTSGSKVQQFLQDSDHHLSHGMVQPCSNLQRTSSPIPQKEVMLRDKVPSCPVSTSTATMQLWSGKDEGQLSSLRVKNIDTPPQIEHPSSSVKLDSKDLMKKVSHYEKKMCKRESLCNCLFENWASLTCEVNQVDDEDWLFGGRKDEEAAVKRLKGSDASQGCMDSLPCSASAALQPRAHYLTDVGTYALPFTVPF